MATEVLLIQNVANLGKIGDIVKVAPGYARNFLLPQKKATAVTASALRSIEARKAAAAAQEAVLVESLKLQAEAIGKIAISIAVKASDDEHLYGSVSVGQIIDALVAHGHTIEKSAVQIAEPIKTLGDYVITIKLHSTVQASLKLAVVRI